MQRAKKCLVELLALANEFATKARRNLAQPRTGRPHSAIRPDHLGAGNNGDDIMPFFILRGENNEKTESFPKMMIGYKLIIISFQG
jgi:hypothetical protein